MTKLIDRIKHALSVAPGILKDRSADQGQSFEGFTYQQMQSYGLTKRDLKKLERHGLALSGYDKDATGFRRRWILLGQSHIEQVVKSWDF